MKWTLIVAAGFLGSMVTHPTAASEALAKSNGCLNCHAVDAKKVGPAFKEVAAKYKGKGDAEAMLTAKLAEGKGHPATKAKPDDLKTIVKWVLAQ